ncbi:MAG: toxin-antitoxin system YwqK family antitoxin [bacterium]|nr:toxin-antitoxin system YwqK family antitoxin [bacterium]
MKKLVLVVLALVGFSFLNAQVLNDKGLYIDSDGEAFNGTISKTTNGITSEFEVKEGVINGAATYFYASGNVMEKGMFTAGKKDLKWIRYTESGSIAAIAFYNLGKKAGTWLVYDESGKKRFEMNYTDGEKTGIWTSWDENGAVADTKDYSKVN